MTREEAIQELQNCKGLIQQDGQDYLDERDYPLLDIAIEALQTEVVRCKDCKHSRIEGDTTMFMWCGYWNKPTDHVRYCSLGERREE